MQRPSPVSIIAVSLIAIASGVVWHFSRQQKTPEAQSEAMAITQQLNDANTSKKLAEAYLKDGQYDLAVEYYHQALKLKPNDSQIHNDLASTYHYIGKSTFQMTHYQDAIGSSESEVLSIAEAALKLINSGVVEVKVDTKSQAQKLLDYALRMEHLAYISPEKSKYTTTIVRGEAGVWFLKAESEYRKAIELKTRYAPAYRNLGTLYYEMGRRKEAIDLWRIALRLDPSDRSLKSHLQTLGIDEK